MNLLDQIVSLKAAGVFSVLGGTGGIVALIKSWADRRKIITDTEKVKIEAAAVLSTTAIALVNSMRTQIADLETRVRAAEIRAEAAETILRQCGKCS